MNTVKIRLSFKQPAHGLETTETKIIYINECLRIFWQLYYEEGFIRKNLVKKSSPNMHTCDLEHNMYIAMLVSWIIIFFILAVFWSLSAFIVEILMENLFIGKGRNNFVLSSNTTMENYMKWSESFGTFFLIFFTVIQISAIVNYFLCVSILTNYVSVAFCLYTYNTLRFILLSLHLRKL